MKVDGIGPAVVTASWAGLGARRCCSAFGSWIDRAGGREPRHGCRCCKLCVVAKQRMGRDLRSPFIVRRLSLGSSLNALHREGQSSHLILDRALQSS